MVGWWLQHQWSESWPLQLLGTWGYLSLYHLCPNHNLYFAELAESIIQTGLAIWDSSAYNFKLYCYFIFVHVVLLTKSMID